MVTGCGRLLLALLCLLCSLAGAQQQPVAAAIPKGGLLRHIGFLTVWPASLASEETGPFVVCVLGSDVDGVVGQLRGRDQQLDTLLRRRLTVLDVAVTVDTDDVTVENTVRGCDLMFVPRIGGDLWRRIAPVVAELPIMTVGDYPDFCREGGMIEYFVEETVRMRINLAAVESVGLGLSAKLVRLKTVEHCSPEQARSEDDEA